MSKPRISIITVVYNSEDLIGSTIESIAAQTYENIEYVIVDGNSSDGTMKVIRKSRRADVLISEPDDGLYDAMNKGIKAAGGDYVWFLNSGDQVYAPDTVEKMVKGLVGSPDIIYGGTMIIDSEGKEIGDRRLTPPSKLSWRSFRSGMLVCHQSILVKRELAPLYNVEYRFSADFDWAIRSARAAGEIHNSSLVLSRFLEGGLTSNNIRKGLKERFGIMKDNYGLIPTILRHFIFGVRLTNFYLKNRRI